MLPSFHLEALEKVRWWEHLERFLFGGAVTVATGFIANRYGPAVGGLFLAFPAILPASLTLLEQHDGRQDAAQAAAGARLGAVGLIGFGGVVSGLADHGAPIALGAGVLAWAVIAFGLWVLVYGRHGGRDRTALTRAARAR